MTKGHSDHDLRDQSNLLVGKLDIADMMKYIKGQEKKKTITTLR